MCCCMCRNGEVYCHAVEADAVAKCVLFISRTANNSKKKTPLSKGRAKNGQEVSRLADRTNSENYNHKTNGREQRQKQLEYQSQQ